MVSPILTSQSLIPNASHWSKDVLVILFFMWKYFLDLNIGKGIGNCETMRHSFFFSRQILELSETHLYNYYGFWILEMVNGMEKYFQYFNFFTTKNGYFQKYNLCISLILDIVAYWLLNTSRLFNQKEIRKYQVSFHTLLTKVHK